MKAGEHRAWRLQTNSSGSSKPEIDDDARDDMDDAEDEESDADESEEDKDRNRFGGCSTSELFGTGRSAQRSEARASQISITCKLRRDFPLLTTRFCQKQLPYFLDEVLYIFQRTDLCFVETKNKCHLLLPWIL